MSLKQCSTLYALRLQKCALAPINFYFMKHEEGTFLRKAHLRPALKVWRICALRFALNFYELLLNPPKMIIQSVFFYLVRARSTSLFCEADFSLTEAYSSWLGCLWVGVLNIK